MRVHLHRIRYVGPPRFYSSHLSAFVSHRSDSEGRRRSELLVAICNLTPRCRYFSLTGPLIRLDERNEKTPLSL